MYQYAPKFVLNSIEVYGKSVPISKFAKAEDIPRLLFKLYCETDTKDCLAGNTKLMKQFFGSAQKGSKIMNQLFDKEWEALKYSVATKDT